MDADRRDVDLRSTQGMQVGDQNVQLNIFAEAAKAELRPHAHLGQVRRIGRRFSRYRNAYLEALLAACGSASRASTAVARLPGTSLSRLPNVSAIRSPLPDMVADASPGDWETIAELLSGTSGQARVLVFGGLGMGKTTQAESLVRVLARAPRRGSALPLLVRLDGEAVAAIKTDAPLPALTRRTTPAVVTEEPRGWLEDQLARGRCVVVVDDTSEVAERDWGDINKWLRKQFALYPDVSFLVTCGPFGGDELRPGCTACLEVRPLAVDQVGSWLEGAGSAFKSRLRTIPGLWAFAGNPRLLEVMIRCDAESHVPDERVPRDGDFLAAVCEVLLGGAERAVPGMTADVCYAVLGEFAFHICAQHDSRVAEADAARMAARVLAGTGCGVSAGDFLRVLRQLGILEWDDVDGKVSCYFAHPVIQDFFAADYLTSERPDGARLSELVEDPWWGPALRLFAERGERFRIVEACVRRDHPSGTCLALALDCLARFQGEIVGPLQLLAAEAAQLAADAGRQSQVASLLARLNDATALGGNSQLLRQPLTNADYQLFADSVGGDGRRYFLDHWNAGRFPPGTGGEPATGIRRGDLLTLCDWLTRQNGGYWRYRVPDQAEIRSASGLVAAAGTPDCRFWVQDRNRAGCLGLPSAQVTGHLRRQMEMDILRELSPSMSRLIAQEKWQRLRSAVRVAGKAPSWGLDPRLEKELDLDVPAEPLAALAVVLAEHHAPVAAGEVAAELGIKERDLSPARRVLAAILERQDEVENIDPDTVLSLSSGQHRAVIDLPRAYSPRDRPDKDAQEEARTAVGRLRWLASTSLHAADGAIACPREQDMPWSSVKVLRWCARVAALLLAIEASRLAADPDVLPVTINHRLSAGGHGSPAKPAALSDELRELATIGTWVYVGLALVDIRSRPGLSNLGGAVLLAREPAYRTLPGGEGLP
jgi:hypothetical protein